MQNGDKVNFVECTTLPATTDSATFYHIKDTSKLYLGSTLLSDNSDEIVARLKATVGHSAINLFKPSYRQGTSANTTTATAVCSLTVIPTEYGRTHIFRKYNSDFSIRIYGTNDEGKAIILAGGGLSSSLRLYEGSYIYDESWTHTNETQGVTCYVIMVRKPNFPLAETVTYQNITPADVPSNLVMVTDSSISDDTFEPYVTPTDERIPPMLDSPINHNGIYRGKDLTNVYTVDEIHNRVQNGSFDDLYLGDYFTVSITTDIYTKFIGSSFASGTIYYERSGYFSDWTYTATSDTSYDSSKTYYTKATVTEDASLMIAHFNYYTNARFTDPHILLINRNYGFVTTAKMNSTNTTVDGYYNSEMHQTTLPCYAKSLNTALKGYLVLHDSLLTNVVDVDTLSMAGAGEIGASTGWTWAYNTVLQLMTEQQLVGSSIWTSSAYDVGCDGNKLAVFNFINPGQYEQGSFWLRTITANSEFACYNTSGYGKTEYIFRNYANSTAHVRPLIVFG